MSLGFWAVYGGDASPNNGGANVYANKFLSSLSILSFFLNLSVAVSKLQVAILARSSREMYQTVRIDWRSILSRVRVSIRPRHFFTRKTPKTIAKPESSASVCWMNQRATRRKGVVMPVTVDRSPATSRNGNNMSGDNYSHSGDRLSQKRRKPTR